tara:strand:- start:221 stop:388 length:168 start_codon:yes stop_codon:yes gene_type:complete
MDNFILVVIGVVCLIILSIVYHILTWNPFDEKNQPNYNESVLNNTQEKDTEDSEV